MEKEQARQIARAAVEALAEAKGEDAKFSFDVIWEYADPDNPIPSQMRPARSRELIRDGYIVRTGAMINATSESRAGSITPEYRLGPRFRKVVDVQADKSSVVEGIKNLEAALNASGFVVSAAEIANFYLALAASPLVILTGISGTGKSKLPRLFAGETDSAFYPIPVKPQWSDNSDLFGYTPSLAPENFVTGEFTKAVLEAKANPERLSLVLLDEMNLAPVEHYFSDFLSVAETRRRENKEVITDRLPLDLPPKEQTSNDYSELRELYLPRNVRVIGTANMDETTHLFSPKVLDRAFSIEFDDPDLTNFAGTSEADFQAGKIQSLAASLLDPSNPISVQEAYGEAENLFTGIAVLLEEVKEILKPAGISFGYRTRNDICLYMYFWQKFELDELLSATAAMDFCLLQKVLPKIHGTGESLAVALDKLKDWLQKGTDEPDVADAEPWASRPWTRSAEKVQRMINKLESESSTTYWGT